MILLGIGVVFRQSSPGLVVSEGGIEELVGRCWWWVWVWVWVWCALE